MFPYYNFLVNQVPDYKTQKQELQAVLKKNDETDLANGLQEKYGEWCSLAAHTVFPRFLPALE